MSEAFERGFLSELKSCLTKVAGADAREVAEAMGDVEALEHRLRHLAPAKARQAVHERGQALARERTRGLHDKTASPFGAAMQVLAGRLLGDG